MAAKAICDVCGVAVVIETTPLGVALMPELWFCSIREVAGEITNLDVCSETCATDFDKKFGRPDGKKETTIIDAVDGEVTKKTLVHEAQLQLKSGD